MREAAVPLAHSLPFDPATAEDTLAQLPHTPGVFLLRPHDDGAEPYVSKSADLRKRITRLLAAESGASRRLNLRERCAGIEYSLTGSDFENALLLYRTIKAAFPTNYSQRIKLAAAPLVRIEWENAYPRAYITRRLTKFVAATPAPSRENEALRLAAPEVVADPHPRRSAYFGPFRSRATAEQFLNDALDLFKSRRCNFELHPDPAFPGCVYSEMKMCLAPCFKGCTDEEYLREVERVQQFLETQGHSLWSQLAAEREAASAALEFEAAAAIHQRVEKAKAVARECDSVVRRLEQLDAIILQRGVSGAHSDLADESDTQEAIMQTVAVFRLLAGELLGPVHVGVPSLLVQQFNKHGAGDDEATAESEENAAESVPSRELPASPTHSAMKRARHELQAAIGRAIESLTPDATLTPQSRAEQLAIFKRWFYRSQRMGEYVPTQDFAPPLRRLARLAVKLAARK